MSEAESTTNKGTPIGSFAARAVLQVEVLTYVILGFLLAATALLGIGNAGMTLWKAAQDGGQANSLVLSIDRLLFVLMVVEILHTVRVLVRSGRFAVRTIPCCGLDCFNSTSSGHNARIIRGQSARKMVAGVESVPDVYEH